MAPLKASMAAPVLSRGQGGVAVGNELPVGPLPLAEGVAVDPGGAQSEQKQPGQDPFHGVNVSRGVPAARAGTFPGSAGI